MKISLILLALIAPTYALASGSMVKGYVSNGATVPVSGNLVILTDPAGREVATDTSSWTGGYKLKNIPNGQYVLSTGQFATTIRVTGKTIRQDFDLSRPDGKMNWGQYALEETLKVLQKANEEEANRKAMQAQSAGGSYGSGGSSGWSDEYSRTYGGGVSAGDGTVEIFDGASGGYIYE